MTSKKEFRLFAKQLLKEMPSKERKEIEQYLIKHLITTDYWNEASTLGITISQQLEWDTRAIITKAWAENKKVCVPKCFPEVPELVFYSIETFDQLESSYFNLLEPNPEITKKIEKNQLDLMIVPGLLFDNDGYRIGFGGGYYDRYLKGYHGTTISLTSNKQLFESLPKAEYDIAVKHLITESGLLK